MGTLQLDVGNFYRIKVGQTAREVEKILSTPVNYSFDGAIVRIEKCTVYMVQPFETYGTIAANLGIEEEKLKKFNGDRPLYPCRIIFIPLK